jgi:hypothetical protein
VTRAVLVPSAPVLLPEYAGLVDPVPELRAACTAAVAGLAAGDSPTIGVLAAPARPDNVARGVSSSAGQRIARHLLSRVGWSGQVTEPAPGVPLVVVGNGTACRSEKAPGHLDARAAEFDRALGVALVGRDTAALRALDPRLAEALWCHDAPAFSRLAEVLAPGPPAEVQYDGDPFGVQYWVLTWL